MCYMTRHVIQIISEPEVHRCGEFGLGSSRLLHCSSFETRRSVQQSRKAVDFKKSISVCTFKYGALDIIRPD